MTQKKDDGGMLETPPVTDNTSMEELLNALKEIGLPSGEVQRVGDFYRDDEPGLKDYVLYMRAILDDRHEYLV